MSCKCQRCGNQYKVDIGIPSEIWENIKPEGEPVGAGFLCGSCIIDKIEECYDYGIWSLQPLGQPKLKVKNKNEVSMDCLLKEAKVEKISEVEDIGVVKDSKIVPIESVEYNDHCLKCNKIITKENDSGWEAFVTGSTTQKVCKDCHEPAPTYEEVQARAEELARFM